MGGGVDQLGFFCWEVEDGRSKNERGDPKIGEGVEMNLEIFLDFGGGFIIILHKMSRDTQNWGRSIFFLKNTSHQGIFGTFSNICMTGTKFVI